MAADLFGRDVTDQGTLATVDGVLYSEDGEWYLKSGEESYALHMGFIGHEEGDVLVENSKAQVYGFMLPGHISPVSITSDGTTYRFWAEDGTPQWSGSGNRRNLRPDNRAGMEQSARTERGTGLLKNQADRQGRGRI